MELWDAFDESLNLLPFTLVRGEEIPIGVFHLVVEIFVQHTDGDLLLMQRDYHKKMFGGYFEISCGGSVLKGEQSEKAAYRELFEETGITPLKLRRESTYVDYQEQTIFIEYYALTNMNKKNIVYQKEETIGHIWMNQNLFKKIIKSNQCITKQIKRFESTINQLS